MSIRIADANRLSDVQMDILCWLYEQGWPVEEMLEGRKDTGPFGWQTVYGKLREHLANGGRGIHGLRRHMDEQMTRTIEDRPEVYMRVRPRFGYELEERSRRYYWTNKTWSAQTASERAAVSRSFRRLEDRGLIERAGRRCWLLLTPEGYELAERLAIRRRRHAANHQGTG